jgi:aspartyl-tRNA(Asn)/glutamyl-tRNA(Gln) amidotransferase subunit B
VRETRHFDETTGRTVRLRLKESAADYRYLPDPDLLPFPVASLAPAGEDPRARRARVAAAVGLPEEQVSPIFEERALVDAVELAAARAGWRPAFDFVVRDLRAELEFRKLGWSDARVAASELADLVAALARKQVTAHVGTRILRHGLDHGGLAAELAKELGASAAGDLDADARAVLAENPKAAADYRAGKTATLNFLVGQLMRRTKGRAAPDAARLAMEKALGEGS